MKMKSRLMLFMVLGFFVSLSLLAQEPASMTGTWVGSATLEGMGAPNELTLVLELKEGNLVGHMSDQFETMTESPISDVELSEGTFKFSTYAMGPGGQNLTLIFLLRAAIGPAPVPLGPCTRRDPRRDD